VTVDDLIGVYIEASNAVVWEAEKRDLCPMSRDIQRAGVIAIVRALRSELAIAHNEGGFMMATTKQCNGPAYADWRINSILGDAGEKVAEMPDLPTRTVQLTGVTRSQRPDIQFEPATDAAPAFYAGQDPKISLNTDAAPAVCEWTSRGRNEPGFYSTPHGIRHMSLRHDSCVSCGKPIKFTEANHG